MRASTLRWAIKRYYRSFGYKVHFPKGGLKVGNAMIDGEAVREGSRVAIELKSDRDDILRGLGQLLQALTHGYTHALLVTSQRRAEGLDPVVFQKTDIVLAAVNSYGDIVFIAEP